MKKLQTQIGVDVGKTWVRAALRVDGRARLRRARRKIARRESLPGVLRSILTSWNLRCADLMIVGSTGVWHLKDRRHMERQLAFLARRVRVLSDLELAWSSCLRGKPGVLVVAGTGSAAYAKDPCGHYRRAGGWGQLLGDEGSAFWIGKRWLALKPEDEILRFAHRPDVIRKVSALARKVLRASKTDTRAKTILREAVLELARLAARASSTLHFPKRIPVSWWGGMFKNPAFTAQFKRGLRRLDARLEPTPAASKPEEWAAIMDP